MFNGLAMRAQYIFSQHTLIAIIVLQIQFYSFEANIQHQQQDSSMQYNHSQFLQEALSRYGLITTASLKLFKEHATISELPKNCTVFAENKQNNSEYIVLNGILHRFIANENGDDTTIGFYQTATVVTPHFSRTINSKNLFTLQTLTSAIVAEISVTTLDTLRMSIPEFREFGQRVLEAELSANVLNDVMYRSMNAKDKLLQIRKTFPNIENLIPHTAIASYLGITNVSFSRLRNELSRQ